MYQFTGVTMPASLSRRSCRVSDREIKNSRSRLRRRIREGCLTVEQADPIKEDLERNRFVMKIGSF